MTNGYFDLLETHDLPNDYLIQIARVAIEWSRFERSIAAAICELLEIFHIEDCLAATLHVPHRVRQDTLLTLSDVRLKSDDLKQEIKKLIGEANDKQFYRNLVVHHEWSGVNDPFIMLTKARGEIERRAYQPTLDDLRQLADDIKSIRQSTVDWAGRAAIDMRENISTTVSNWRSPPWS